MTDRFEYSIQLVTPGQLPHALTAAGTQGWELVSVEKEADQERLIFKRRVSRRGQDN